MKRICRAPWFRRSRNWAAPLTPPVRAGGDALSNGALVAAATDAEFSALLTRDRLFAESAAQALKRYPVIGIVVIVLPQLRSQQFIDAFRTAWIKQPIEIVPAEVIKWPSS